MGIFRNLKGILDNEFHLKKGEVALIESADDPSTITGGYTAEKGSLLLQKPVSGDGKLFVKYDTGDSDWRLISTQIWSNSTFLKLDQGTPQSIINGRPIFTEGITLSNTTNQLILGTTNTVTISSTAPSASRVYTIADFGGAANLMLGSATSGFAKFNGLGLLTAATTNPDTIAVDTKFTTGILNIHTSTTAQRVNTTLSFDVPTGSHIFTIAPAGGSYTTFDVYLSGKKTTFNSAQTIDLDVTPGSLTANTIYFIYFYDNAGTATLTASATPWEINSNAAPIATLFWNGTDGIIGDERHDALRNLVYHKWAHQNIGTRWTNGLAGSFATGSMSIAVGAVADEDIVLSITSPQTQARIWYTTTGPASTFDGLSSLSAYVITGALQYNPSTSVSPVTSGSYVRNYVYATNDIAYPIAIIVGQSEYTNINDARNDPFPTQPTYISNEIKLLYTTIWQNVGGTPTFVEATDFRTAPTQANGTLAIRPIFLDEIQDVSAATPSLNQVLTWNGLAWTNGAPATSSAGPGVEFFNASPDILATGTNNANYIRTLSKTPITTAEQTAAATATTNTVFGSAWLYNTALGRTSIDAGTWSFTSYAYVNSVTAGRVTYMQRGIYSVLPQDGGVVTVSITGTGTSRTATASGGTPFATTKIDASATNTVASYLQTPTGMFQITARTSDTVVTINTLTTYTNESTVTFNVWKRLFIVSSPAVTATSLATIGTYNWTSAQAAFTITALHKFGAITFVTSNNTTTLTTTYDGTARSTHFDSPLITLHNELSGLQGGAANDYYHLTLAQATVATQAATGSLNGYLSSVDWTTFNGKENALTFSTGLTRNTNTITNDLSTGKAGGQTIYGGTAASENLDLHSTSNATKGEIKLNGTTGNYWSVDGAGILRKYGTASYYVAANTYVFQSADVPNIGFYFDYSALSLIFRGISAEALFATDLSGNSYCTTALYTPSIYGSIAASGNLTLNSTLHATKGKILLGTSAYDELNNRLGIGTNTPATKLHVVETITTSPRGIMSAQHNAGTEGARLHTRKSRGTSASPTVITSGDILGSWIGSGHDGTNYLEMASIDFLSTGTIASTRVPTKMVFSTATDAAPSVLTERMAISPAGVITMSGLSSAVSSDSTGVDIIDGSIALVMGAENTAKTRGATVTKYSRFGFAHYNNVNKPFCGFYATGGQTVNTLNIGGGTSLLTSATAIVFLTNATNTTAGAATDEKMRLDSTGYLGLGTYGTIPRRKLDVLDASNPQLRLTYTDNSVYTDFQTTSAGRLDMVSTGGQYSIKAVSASEYGVLGTEKIVAGTTWEATDWTVTDYNTLTHVSGTDAAVSTNVSVTAGTSYEIGFTISGRTTGSVSITLGWSTTANMTVIDSNGTHIYSAVSPSPAYELAQGGTSTTQVVFLTTRRLYTGQVITVRQGDSGVLRGTVTVTTGGAASLFATSTLAGMTIGDRLEVTLGLIFIPTTGFDGSIDLISVRPVTVRTATLLAINSSGTVCTELRTASSASTGTCLYIGLNAGGSLTTGLRNSGFGESTLQRATTGTNNTCTGFGSGGELVSGSYNSILGALAGSSLTVGNYNVAIGYNALAASTTANNNIAIGSNAGSCVTSGGNNVFIGWQSGYATTLQGIITGTTNTFVGYNTGSNALQLTTATNSTAIGNGAYTTANNQVIIGNTSVTAVGIGTFYPSNDLSFGGNIARLIGVERHTTADTAGNNLTIFAGGASSKQVATVSVVAGGGGYTINNTLKLATPVGGTAATVTVSAVTAGVVTGVTLATAGSGYTTGTKVTTGGAGSGCTVSVDTLTAGSTDKGGGILYLQPGVSTGTGFSSIRLKRNTRAAATGVTDNAALDSFIIPSAFPLANNSATTVFTFPIAASMAVGGIIRWTLVSKDATNTQSISGATGFTASRTSGTTYASAVSTDTATSSALTTGTLTGTWSIAATGGTVTVSFNGNSSLTPTSHILYYTVDIGGTLQFTQA